MKTSRLIGGMVVVGIGIGAALNYFLPDLNFGLGSNGFGLPTGQTEDGGPEQGHSDTKVQTTLVGIDETPPSETVAETVAPQSPPAVVYVLIDDRNYLLRRGPEGKAAFKPAGLDEVIEAALAATGDDNGIRIRIAQKSSSRETTERALRNRLDEAGVPKDSIRWKDEPID